MALGNPEIHMRIILYIIYYNPKIIKRPQSISSTFSVFLDGADAVTVAEAGSATDPQRPLSRVSRRHREPMVTEVGELLRGRCTRRKVHTPVAAAERRPASCSKMRRGDP